ncbi:hypothetical protein FIBSPDRAFT_757765 [Athelia psychrophila]|uniref:J domain-containing protein n=1 Tax=Athelia psychrophila TaxID=1759441 RepID=A0A165ZLF0_9AGAM|nr:hypothetical protein FIBSPDRAFT_757765 [Fibularhizoctonia sp. CBS 109695]
MSSYALLSLAGWSYIPDLATKQVLQLAYTSSLPIPHRFRPDPRKHPRNYRLTFALISLTYLTYSLISSLYSTPPNFYEILHITPEADDSALKTAFRNFAKVYHPDRRGGEGEEWFAEVRAGYEALRDPVVRFAYDRFGEDVLTWQNLSTRAEYVHRGLLQASGYHISTIAALLFFGALGRPSPIAFWRYWLCAILFAAELYLLLSPTLYSTSDAPLWISALTWTFPTRVAFQHVRFLHHLFVFGSVGLSRVAPVVLPLYYEFLGIQTEEFDLNGEAGQKLSILIARFSGLVQAADRELFGMIQTDIQSLLPEGAEPRAGPEPPAEILEVVEKEMRNIMIESRLRTTAPLMTAWQLAVRKGREILRARTQSAPEPISEPIGNGNGNGHALYLPSPVSPEDALGISTGADIVKEAELIAEGRLPSPRPSPPPGLVRRGTGSSFRARSVSC